MGGEGDLTGVLNFLSIISGRFSVFDSTLKSKTSNSVFDSTLTSKTSNLLIGEEDAEDER